MNFNESSFSLFDWLYLRSSWLLSRSGYLKSLPALSATVQAARQTEREKETLNLKANTKININIKYTPHVGKFNVCTYSALMRFFHTWPWKRREMCIWQCIRRVSSRKRGSEMVRERQRCLVGQPCAIKTATRTTTGTNDLFVRLCVFGSVNSRGTLHLTWPATR